MSVAMIVVVSGIAVNLIDSQEFASASEDIVVTPPSESSGESISLAPMQMRHHHPIWLALAGQGLSNAEWAHLLITDADGNGRTDFLDMVMQFAPLWPDLQVELLAYGLTSSLGEPMLGIPAQFIVIPLAQVDAVDADLLVWEPRAYVSTIVGDPGSREADTPPDGTSALWQTKIHQADTAWSQYDGDGIEIAIMDTGADGNHPAFPTGKIVGFKDCTSSATSVYDNHGHGTHVASIAAGNHGSTFKGIAHGADLRIVKILDGSGSGTLSQFQCGILYLQNSGNPLSEIASISAGLAVPPLSITTLNGGEFDLFGWDTMASYLPAAGIFTTVAAGNHIGTVAELYGIDESAKVGVNGVNQVSSPGFEATVLTIGAVDDSQAPGTFTGIGPGKFGGVKPDLVAHGVDTWGALKSTSLYVRWDGTSMSTPIAAASLAILLEKDATQAFANYPFALRAGADPSCMVALSPASCLAHQPSLRPRNVDGWGVIKIVDSLSYI